MQIFSSIRGSFIEPTDLTQTVQDLVSFLQFEAHTAQETQVLRDIYMIILRGGTLHVKRDHDGFRVYTEAIGPEQKNAVRASDESSTLLKKPRRKAAPAVVPSPTAPPVVPAAHDHHHSAANGIITEPNGDWLKCACGDWTYVERQRIGMRFKKDPKATKKPN